MKRIVHILTFLLISVQAISQTFPVQVTPQVTPPYPVYVSDYANPNSTIDRVRLQVLFNDLTINNREVRLKVYLEGEGILAESNDVVIGALPLFIDGGIPLQLGSAELAPYFEFQNLRGINPNTYGRALPEGIYQFCFEVYDVLTGNRLSPKTCTSIALFQNEPPFLNLPYNESVILEQNPLNIVFQWTPRHINVSNVQYEFSLVEILDNYIDPQVAFLSSPPVFQTTTRQTTLIYGPAFPQLLTGKRYAWRVRAFALDGVDEIGVFTNQGNSEIFWFSYQTQCKTPAFATVEETGDRHAKINWQGKLSHLDYTIKYREKNANSSWYELSTPREYITIDKLAPGTTYEYKIAGNCEFGNYGETIIYEFTTLSEEASAYIGCNIEPDPADLSNQELLPELFVNDIITAGDFPVTIKQLDQTTSPFKGGGYVTVPWLGDTKIAVAFTGIQVNTDMKLVSGDIKTTYDADWGNISDIDEIVEVIAGDTGNIGDYDAGDMDISNVIVDDNGNIIIIDENEIEHPIEADTPVIITDQNNEQWLVDEDGVVTPLGETAEGGVPDNDNTNGISGNGSVNQISSPDVTVTFNASGFYDIDEYPENVDDRSILKKYETIAKANGGDYKVLYKAISDIPDHQTDELIANATFTNGKTKEDIVFKTLQGTAVATKWNATGTEATLTLEKQFDYAKSEIIAAVKISDTPEKFDIAGKTNVWHFDQQQINVKLIPVNGASLAGIGDRINEIYNPVGVYFNVTAAASMSVSNTTIDVGDSSLLSHYTEGEKAWIDQFKAAGNYQPDTYYLFVTDISPTDTDTAGFMPLKRQFGFVFPSDDTGTVAAHELGHGVFGLTHYDQKGTDPFLMHHKYTGNAGFTHMDWETIHAPGLQLYLFQGDEDGESIGISKLSDLDKFSNSDGTYSFISPSGEIITLPKNTRSVYFSTGDTYGDTGKIAPLGSLVAFVQGGGIFTHKIGEKSEKSKGYSRKKGSGVYEPYIDNLTEKLGEKNISPIIGKLCLNQTANGFIFQVTSVSNVIIEEYKKHLLLEEGNLLIGSDSYIKSIDYINNLFIESSQIASIEIENESNIDEDILFNLGSTFDDELVQQYIIRNSENAQCDSPYVPYIIGLSKLITKYPEIHKVCNTVNDRVYKDAEVQRELQGRYNAIEKMNNAYYSGGDYIALESSNNVTNDSEQKNLFKSYFKLYSKASLGYNDFYKKVKSGNLDKIFKAFSNLKECECSLKQLTFDERFLLFKKIVNDNPTKTDDYQELVMAILFNTPSDQMQRWYSISSQEENVPAIMNLYNKFNDLNKEKYVHFFVNLASNFGSPPEFPLKYPGTIRSNDDTDVHFNEDNYFRVHNSDVFSDCDGVLRGMPPCKLFTTKKVNYRGKTPYEKNTIRFGYYSSSTTETKQIVQGYQYVDGNPLTAYVKIEFLDNFNYAGLKSGESKIVPLIWAYHLAFKHNQRIEGLVNKIALSTIALVPSIISGNPTPLIVLDVILNVGTIAIALNDDVIQGTQEGKDFIKLWDNLNAIYGTSMAATGVLNVAIIGGKGLYKIVTKGGKFTKSLKDISQLENGLTKLDEINDAYTAAIRHSKSIGSHPNLIKFENLVDQSFKEAYINKAIKEGFNNVTLEVKNYEVLKIGNKPLATLNYLDETKKVLVADFKSTRLPDDALLDGYESIGKLAVNTKSNGKLTNEIVEVFKELVTGNYFVKSISREFDFLNAFVTISNAYIATPFFETHAALVIEELLEKMGVENNKNKAKEITKMLKDSWGVFNNVKGIKDGINDFGQRASKSAEAVALANAIDDKFPGGLKRIIAKDEKITIDDKTYAAEDVIKGFKDIENNIIKAGKKQLLDNETVKVKRKIDNTLFGSTVNNFVTSLSKSSLRNFISSLPAKFRKTVTAAGILTISLNNNPIVKVSKSNETVEITKELKVGEPEFFSKSVVDFNTGKEGLLLIQKNYVGETGASNFYELNIPFKKGKNPAEIFNKTKSSRPENVNEYLEAEYISNHQQLFKNEGGAFVVVKSWLEKSKYSEYPKGKFVMLKSDMDKVILEYNGKGKNTDYLEHALGYNKGSLKGEELYVFYVKGNGDGGYDGFDFPNGKGDGSNSYWMPGGKTSGGFWEATLRGPPFEHNKNIETLKKAFSYKKLNNARSGGDFTNYIKTLKTQTNPRKNLPDGKFEKKATGDDIQYEAIGGGEKIWADGVDIGKKALLDAKHNPGNFYTIDSYNQKPFLYGDLDDEFRRYAKIIGDKSNPADELIIYISTENQNSILLFEHLGAKYNVPVKIELIPWKP